jgi:hypothetical protein
MKSKRNSTREQLRWLTPTLAPACVIEGTELALSQAFLWRRCSSQAESVSDRSVGQAARRFFLDVTFLAAF